MNYGRSLLPATVGFDRLLSTIEEFDKLFVEGNKLYVNGAIKTVQTEGREYLHRGIGTRNFSHKYTVADTVVVKGADIVDGLLVINLKM